VGVKIPVVKTITGATNATPIVVTSAAHGLANGDILFITDVGGNTNANGERKIKNVATNTFELTDLNDVNIAGNAAYTSGGSAQKVYDQPVNSDCFGVYNLSYEHDVKMYTRQDIRGNLMSFPSIAGARMGKISFSFDLHGSGSLGIAPDYGEALKMCGQQEILDPTPSTGSVIYKPMIAANNPGSVAMYIDGQRYAISGAMGTVKYVANSGEPWHGECEFFGAMVDPAEVAVPTGFTFDSAIPPAWLGSVFTLIGVTAQVGIRSAAFDLGANVIMRPDATHRSGYRGAWLASRRSLWQVVCETPHLTVNDLYSKMNAVTTGLVQFAPIGTVEGNRVQVLANVGNVEKVTPTAQDGLWVSTVDGQCSALGSTSEGDDIQLKLT
jgi:hypothetical protein